MSEVIVMPYNGTIRITNLFGSKPAGITYSAGYHTGIDFVGVDEKNIRAVCAGTVFHVGDDDDGWGNYVIVKTATYYMIYCHMSSKLATLGQAVNAGDILGVEGSTGNSTGSHCHLEIRTEPWESSTAIDPAEYLGIKNEVGVLEVIEMLTELEIELNGEVKTVEAITKDDYNYIKLQDLRDTKIIVDYDTENKRPKITSI